jgi:cholesterol oxidase
MHSKQVINNFDYDYIIIGSGFGGSVSALRLCEKGYKVLIIEKGKDFNRPEMFPKTNWNIKKFFWLPSFKMFGIQKMTFMKHITVLSGVGVGGGSLVYANTLPKPKSNFFNHGPWKDLEDWENKLNPYYDLAWTMLGAAENKKSFDTDHALKKLAIEIGKEDKYTTPKVAVYFGEEGKVVNDPYFDGKGPQRTGCIQCGACMTGCRHNAKNTLDKNYLYLAKKLGLEILAEHEVFNITPLDNNSGKTGYEVKFKQSTKYLSKLKSLTTKSVIFSGGVIGTIPLLLSLKEKSLPNLSSKVGEIIRTNNESLILNVTPDKNIDFTKGIAIASMVEIDEHTHLETVRYGRGSGFWRLLVVPLISEPKTFKRLIKFIIEPIRHPKAWFKILTIKDFAKHSSVHLFMQHLDSTLKLKKTTFGINTELSEGPSPTAFLKQAHDLAFKYCKIIGGKPMVLFLETLLGTPSTAHILGGACMGKNQNEGVIDKDNKVFGYENMYVFDGSMISANPGVNPSLSITAITEYGMTKFPLKNESL